MSRIVPCGQAGQAALPATDIPITLEKPGNVSAAICDAQDRLVVHVHDERVAISQGNENIDFK
jgi:hypothetical protein